MTSGRSRLNYNGPMKTALSPTIAAAIDERYQRLIPTIQQLPHNGSRPLTVSGRVAGWITGKATHHIADMPGVQIEDEAVHITAVTSRRLSLTRVLEQLATGLKGTGCLRGWRDELLDVIGEGEQLAVIERAAMRPLGLLTRAVHLNAWTPDGKMWVARRAPDKHTDPGMWDTLVGGLAVAGESLDLSLLRESDEEAGLQPEQLAQRSALRTIVRMHRQLPEGYQVEDVLVSDCVLDESVVPVNKDGEVSEFRLLSCQDLWDMIEEGQFTCEAELTLLDSLRRRCGA